MFPYVGCPVFNARGEKRRWKLRCSDPKVEMEGTLYIVMETDIISNGSDGTMPSLDALSVASSSTQRIHSQRRKLSFQCRKFSTLLFDSQCTLTREQKILCDFPNISALKCLLNRCGEWNFDPFLLNRLSGGHPIWCLGWRLFEIYDFQKVFHLDWTCIFYCLRLIEEGYSSNRFHNKIHAADVGQALHCFLGERAVAPALTPLHKMGSILAAFGHDLYHRGLNQKFLENSNHFLCSLYNNVSVLENFHWRCLVSILIESGLVRHFAKNQWEELLRILELLILATDMQRQQEYLNQFQVFLRCTDPSSIGDGSSSNTQLMQILIKCADIGNPCRPWKLSQEWSYRASSEFFSQGDEERRLNMPLTSFCDRYSTSVPKIQSGFMEFIAQPLFTDWDKYMHSQLSGLMLRNLKANCQRWTELLHSEILAGAVSGTSECSADSTIRSSLEEVAELETQLPDILQRRRVSASVLLTTPYRRSSNSLVPVRISRRVSLPVTLQSSTLWTVKTTERHIIETQSVEELNAPGIPISFHRASCETGKPPSSIGLRSVMPSHVSRLDDLPELQGSTPSLTSPIQDWASPDSAEHPQRKSRDNRCLLAPKNNFAPRRHSEPIIAPPIDLIAKERRIGDEVGGRVKFHLPATNGEGVGRKPGSVCRRGSLPLTLQQLEILRQAESVVGNARSLGSCSTKSSGSEIIQAIEAT